MFDSFGFDPSTFTDAELHTKASELHGKIVWAGRFGSSDLISNLQHYLQLIEMEQSNRFQRYMARDIIQNASKVIESDPELAAVQREQEPATGGKIVPQAKPRKTIQITRTPIDDKPKDEG